MTRLVLIAICLFGILAGKPPEVSASEPQVHFVHAGADRLLSDLEAVMSLTSAEEQKQTDVIKEYLDVFLVGVDRDRLVRMDWIFGDGPVRYRPAIPVDPQNEQLFWQENLIPNGINKGRRFARTLYSTTGTFKGFLRFRDRYAIFAEQREDLPFEAARPDEEVAHLLRLTDNAAVELINQPEGMAERRRSYNSENGLRQELMDGLEKTKTETEDEFELRKLMLENQLDELERLYVDAEHVLLLAKFDPQKKMGTMDLQVEPIPDTELARTVQQLNQEPLSFANVPKSARSNMSLRVRFPLNETRQQNLIATLNLLRKMAHKDADENTEKTANQKEATQEVIDRGFDYLIKNVKTGLADGFIEAHPNADGKHTGIGAFKVEDGIAAVEILKLLENTRDGQQVRVDLDEENGVKIHSFLISEDQHPGFREFFGSYDIYVGTGKDELWIGAGPNAVDEMKAAIREVAGPNTGKASDPFFTMSGRAAPWLDLQAKGNPDAGSEQFQKYRRMMIEAGQPGDDQFEVWANRDGNNLVGQGTTQPGWVRFLGKYLADFSKEQLEE